MNIHDYIRLDADEKPLDRLVSDGGFCSILRTIACVGDSLSSGELESNAFDESRASQPSLTYPWMSENKQTGKAYHDVPDYSWGQFLARDAGCRVYNFSRGGMTAREYIDGYAEKMGYWDPEKACQAYIVALGVNDVINNKEKEIGSAADICPEDYRRNKATFAGEYAHILQRYREIQPQARMFLMTMPKNGNSQPGDRLAKANEAIRQVAAAFPHTYVIDLEKYAPVYDEAFRARFFVGGHLNVAGYRLTAKMVESYIDYLVRHHFEDFAQSGFIGSPYWYK